MKKIISIFLTLFLTITLLMISGNEHHVYAVIDDYDVFCPICGQRLHSDDTINYWSCGNEDYPFYFYCLNATHEFYGTNVIVPNPLYHDFEIVENTGPTCEENGRIVSVCSECGERKTETLYATGHNWKTEKEPTCLMDGSHICLNCGKTEVLNKLGHYYKKTTITKPTCTEEGLDEYVCIRCNDKYEKKVDALGHKVSQYEEKEPTCTEDGYKTGMCSRCDEEDKTVIPALGHDWGEWEITESTCTSNGEKKRICARCNEIDIIELEMLEHTYLEEWTIVDEPTIFKEGKKAKECDVCHGILEEIIPRKSPIPLIAGTTGGLAAVAAGIYTYMKKKAASSIVKKAVENELLDLSFKTRTVQTLIDEEDDFFKILKARTFLEVSTVEDTESLADDAPDLFIWPVKTKKELGSIIERKEELQDVNIAIIVPRKINEKYLKKSLEDEKIVAYAYEDENPTVKFVKCIIPILKPDIKADETLENIGAISDALGIPGVSTIINVYLSGKDIKEIVEAGDMGFVEKADIVGDIASILGFEKVESITGFIDNIDSIKTAVETKDHGYEVKEGVNAVKDIVDTVKDNL